MCRPRPAGARARPGRLSGDKAYSSRRDRPGPVGPVGPQERGERTINALKGFRAVTSRFYERAYVFHGTVTVTAIRLWLRS